MDCPQFGIRNDPGGAVDVQADPRPVEVHQQQTGVRVLGDVPQGGVHPVPPVLGVRERPRVEHVQEAGRSGAETVVALAAGVRGGQEEHLLPGHELPHALVEVVEHLLVVEALRTPLRAEALLDGALSLTARPPRRESRQVPASLVVHA